MDTGGKSGYILGEFSRDSDRGPCIILCCRNNEEYFELEYPHAGLYFFIGKNTTIPLSGAYSRESSELVSFAGEKLDKLVFRSQSDYFTCRRDFSEAGIRMFESDIHPDDKFLADSHLFRSLGNTGPGHSLPDFRVLSLDIETGRDSSIYCIGIHARDTSADFRAVLMRDEEKAPGPQGASIDLGKDMGTARMYSYSSEKAMLAGFFDMLERVDPDIIIGWNVILFDLDFILRRCDFYRIPFQLGRKGRTGKIIRKQTGMATVEVPGRIVIDGPQSLRTGFFTFDDYRLDSVAQVLLGTGKDIQESGMDKIEEIESRFRNDKISLARYNVIDTLLVSLIFEKTGLIRQFAVRSLLTGLRMDRVNMSVAAFDFYMVPRIHAHGFAAIDTRDVIPGNPAAGGYVFTREPGLYDNVAVFDFMSLYPSIIGTFKIDPLSRLMNTSNPVTTPAGIAFSRDIHILPDHIFTLLETRKKAKAAGDSHLSQAVKILMNSYYGVMGTTGCRFYHPDLPTAITATGQWLLKKTSAYMESLGLEVLYGDTDSVFVQMQDPEENSAGKLASGANAFLARHLQEQFGVESRLVLEHEKTYSKFFLTPMRGSFEGSRKRYAGLDSKTGEIEYKGLETVRSDWTDIAKKFQQELYRRFFTGEEVKAWIRGFIDELRQGRYDNDLVYRRRLTKDQTEYTKNIPPHVRALKLIDPDGTRRIRRVSYLMTIDGPVPLEMGPRNIDYAHYREKQIKPVADTVLQFLGTSFDAIIEGEQLDLFE